MMKSSVRNNQKTNSFFPGQSFTGVEAADMVPSHLLFTVVLIQTAPLRKSPATATEHRRRCPTASFTDNVYCQLI